MENLKFDGIKQFITFNKKVQNENSGYSTISVSIPEMTNDALVNEVKYVCDIMKRALAVISNESQKVNLALAATVGQQKTVSKHDAARQFDKGYSILVKLNNEVVIRGLGEEVQKTVQETLGRSVGVQATIDNSNMLMLE